MKRLSIVLSILLLLFAIGCKGETPTPENNPNQNGNNGNQNGNNGNQNTLVIDAANLSGEWVDIKADTEIIVSNLSDDDMYAFRIDGSASKMISKNANSPSINKSDSGSLIITPDENKGFKAKGEELGVSEGKIRLIKIKDSKDREIRNDDKSSMVYKDEDGYEYYEEFFKINLNSAEFKDMDLENLIIDFEEIKDRLGGAKRSTSWGLFTQKGGVIQKEGSDDLRGVRDYTQHKHDDKLKIFMTMKVKSEGVVGKRIVIGSPVDLPVNQEIKITNDFTFFKIPEQVGNVEYVVEVIPNEDLGDDDINITVGNYAGTSFKTNGEFNKYRIPIGDMRKTHTYYIGEITEDVIIRVDSDKESGVKDWGSITIRPIKENEKAYVRFITLDRHSSTFMIDVEELSIENLNFFYPKYSGKTGLKFTGKCLDAENNVLTCTSPNFWFYMKRGNYGNGTNSNRGNIQVFEGDIMNLFGILRGGLPEGTKYIEANFELDCDGEEVTTVDYSENGKYESKCNTCGIEVIKDAFDGDWSFSITDLMQGFGTADMVISFDGNKCVDLIVKTNGGEYSLFSSSTWENGKLVLNYYADKNIPATVTADFPDNQKNDENQFFCNLSFSINIPSGPVLKTFNEHGFYRIVKL